MNLKFFVFSSALLITRHWDFFFTGADSTSTSTVLVLVLVLVLVVREYQLFKSNRIL